MIPDGIALRRGSAPTAAPEAKQYALGDTITLQRDENRPTPPKGTHWVAVRYTRTKDGVATENRLFPHPLPNAYPATVQELRMPPRQLGDALLVPKGTPVERIRPIPSGLVATRVEHHIPAQIASAWDLYVLELDRSGYV